MPHTPMNSVHLQVFCKREGKRNIKNSSFKKNLFSLSTVMASPSPIFRCEYTQFIEWTSREYFERWRINIPLFTDKRIPKVHKLFLMLCNIHKMIKHLNELDNISHNKQCLYFIRFRVPGTWFTCNLDINHRRVFTPHFSCFTWFQGISILEINLKGPLPRVK